ncbi:MAG: GntR family transcriptional regulator [Deltaproteobacteria bacterium]|nr:GntR family transcriptional regulator [Deltaproteobacteria bacterium]
MKIKSLVDHTSKYLEDMIIKGKLRPGQRIKEQEVSSQLGISRPPVREAFKILEAEGLIKREPRRGVLVSEVTKNDIWEVYTLKIALYTLAVTLAIDRISDNGIGKLEKIVTQMEMIVQDDSNPDIIRYEELNNLFHETTTILAGHGRLKKMVQSLNNQIKRVSYRSFTKEGHLKSSCRYHRQILEAIKARDKILAERLTREHIVKGLEVHKELDEEQGSEVHTQTK